jgi:hypothetical protein
MVRSNFRHPAPHKDQARLGVSHGSLAAHQGRGPVGNGVNFAKLPELLH